MSSFMCKICSNILESDAAQNMHPIAIRPCGHVFHYACFRPRSSSTTFKCPICKNPRPTVISRGREAYFRVRFQAIDNLDVTLNSNSSNVGVVQINEAMLDSLKEAKVHDIDELKSELAKIESKKDELRRAFIGMSDLLYDTDQLFDDILSESPSYQNQNPFDFATGTRTKLETQQQKKRVPPNPIDIEALDEMIREFSRIRRSPGMSDLNQS